MGWQPNLVGLHILFWNARKLTEQLWMKKDDRVYFFFIRSS